MTLATRELLTESQRIGFTEIPSDINEFLIARYYTLNDYDLKVINSRRRVHNRLGFAVQLCYLRFPGRAWKLGEKVPKPILSYIALQLDIKPKFIKNYAQRDTTRKEHLLEIQSYFKYESFHMSHYKQLSKWLMQLAWNTDKGIALVEALIDEMRRCQIIIPAISTVERLAWETRRRAQNKFYFLLTQHLTASQKKELDSLLILKEETNRTPLVWLRQPPGVANPKNFLKVMDKFEFICDLKLDRTCLTKVHHNRLVQLTRIGMKNTPAHIARLDDVRRYATLVAFLLETASILVDIAITMHDKMMGKLFRRSENQRDKNFQSDGKAINEKVMLYADIGSALINAREGTGDAYAAIESVLNWEKFVASVEEARKLARPADFDYFDLLDKRYTQLRRYTPKLLSAFEFKASNPASPVLKALDLIKELNNTNRRHIPEDAPVDFIKPRWSKYIFKDGKIDRHYYEMCALSELRDCLRSGDISVAGSRQYKNFEDYLLPQDKWQNIRDNNEIPVAITTDFTTYIEQRQQLLFEQFDIVSNLLANNKLKGTVTASLIMRKLASYSRQNKLALAWREVGRIERTLFTLYWLQSPQLRRKATNELNKGELKNSLARAIFLHRLGEVRDRSFEDQSLRASGLNLAIAAIVLWNTVYLEKAVNWLKSEGMVIPDEYLQHLSQVGLGAYQLDWRLYLEFEVG